MISTSAKPAATNRNSASAKLAATNRTSAEPTTDFNPNGKTLPDVQVGLSPTKRYTDIVPAAQHPLANGRDVLFVAAQPKTRKANDFGSVPSERGGQIAAVWERAWPIVACDDALAMDVSAVVLVIHVKAWCYDLLNSTQLRLAAHVYDPVDSSLGASRVCALFDAVLAQNQEHARALVYKCGARRSFVLGMQTHEVAGCAPRPDESMQAIYGRLPIVPIKGSSCPYPARDPLYVAVPGSVGTQTKPNPTAGNLTVVLAQWATKWCDQQGHSVHILLEYELFDEERRRQAACEGKYLARYNPFAEEPFSAKGFKQVCDFLHCKDVALTIAYKGAPQGSTVRKPAERFLNPMSVGTPTIGD
eukprot:1055447-Prymnesium_polylepis.1